VSVDYAAIVDGLTRVRGVQGAMVVAGQDGVVVAESLMEGVKGRALAALAGSLAKRLEGITRAAAGQSPRFIHLDAEEGTLLVAAGAGDLLVVTLAGPGVPIGLARLETLRAAERLA
jgi:predicted regulator of Ras-like GTPase activity (Roadblock/LC7/MglB family)